MKKDWYCASIILSFFLFLSPSLAISQVSSSAQNDANSLFVLAFTTYKSAEGLPEPQKKKKYETVRRMFEQIVVAYPSSKPAISILSLDKPAGVDKQAINFSADGGNAKTTTIAARSIASDLIAKYQNDLTKLNKVANDADYAILSWAAYGGSEAMQAAAQAGWTPLKNFAGDRFLVGDVSATLFVSSAGEHVLAFRGSEQRRDWITNTLGTFYVLPPLVGQVQDSISVATEVANEFPKVKLTGHSLGGRLAKAASMKTGSEAFVFNSAPIGQVELRKLIFGDFVYQQPKSYRSPQDQLSGIFGPNAVDVANIELVPKVRLFSKGTTEVYVHAIDVLAKAARDVKRARNKGWITAALEESGLNLGTAQINAAGSNQSLDGQLCQTPEKPLTGGALGNLLWGAKLSGTNIKGDTWDEYLAKGGDFGNTIFVNNEGKETIGVYKLTETEVCFSYGTVARWNCKTVSKCLSGEAPYVIRDKRGRQTSLINEVEAGGFAPYHLQRWSVLASQQQLSVPFDRYGKRNFTPIPTSMAAQTSELERIFSGPNLNSSVDRAQCQFTISLTSPIMKQILASGGWSDWLGSTQNGKKKVGENLEIWTIDLESYDPTSSRQGSANGHVAFNPRTGKNFSYRKITRRTDDPSHNSDKLVAIGGFSFTGLNVQRINLLLQDISDVCSGRIAPTVPTPAAQTTNSLSNSEKQSNLHSCSQIENDIARLQCFDSAFPGTVNAAQNSASASENQSDEDTLEESLAQIIGDHPEVVKMQTTFGFMTGTFEAAINQGLVTRVLEHLGPGPRGNSWEAGVTDLGRSRGIVSAKPYEFATSSPAKIEITVTGMTDTSSGENTMNVEFQWNYTDAPLAVRRFAERGGNGAATFKLWNDGWRPEAVQLSGNGIPFALTQKELSEISSDIADTLQRGGPWYWVKREQIFVPVSSQQQ
ncbi:MULTISPECIES: hypothetical protein [unclassified Ruegeria]|uniref:hypothetical protein n=1 Tax=unclassified Ruegeria TaxID=2625375 RepID=UPI0014878725|nr:MULTISPECIES: hypothetical protein [unclassified Ruegeria]